MSSTNDNALIYPQEKPQPFRPEQVVFADFIGYYQALDPAAEINVKQLIRESQIPRTTVYRYMRLYRQAGIATFRVRRAKRRRRCVSGGRADAR